MTEKDAYLLGFAMPPVCDYWDRIAAQRRHGLLLAADARDASPELVAWYDGYADRLKPVPARSALGRQIVLSREEG